MKYLKPILRSSRKATATSKTYPDHKLSQSKTFQIIHYATETKQQTRITAKT